ncbi:hypothetical protein FA13DRAFT_1078588 [Coprinellus micaceus]|uniref:Uncharacterized protein n=1 Tax=Coprinellus micaceus TaxID=71717 RepID=A0A4Y7TR81_COPMI|nr:hypothetical protein FA13DRAFT_1078588 [Coprinellus micaceus]
METVVLHSEWTTALRESPHHPPSSLVESRSTYPILQKCMRTLWEADARCLGEFRLLLSEKTFIRFHTCRSTCCREASVFISLINVDKTPDILEL